MLPPKNRLKKKKDFQRVLSGKQSWKSDCFLVKYRSVGAQNSKIGFVISTKVSSKAVSRNRIKRWLREITRGLIGKIPGAFDIVVIANSRAVKQEFPAVQNEITQLFCKAKLIP